jgi:hypothetical protein
MFGLEVVDYGRGGLISSCDDTDLLTGFRIDFYQILLKIA